MFSALRMGSKSAHRLLLGGVVACSASVFVYSASADSGEGGYSDDLDTSPAGRRKHLEELARQKAALDYVKSLIPPPQEWPRIKESDMFDLFDNPSGLGNLRTWLNYKRWGDLVDDARPQGDVVLESIDAAEPQSSQVDSQSILSSKCGSQCWTAMRAMASLKKAWRGTEEEFWKAYPRLLTWREEVLEFASCTSDAEDMPLLMDKDSPWDDTRDGMSLKKKAIPFEDLTSTGKKIRAWHARHKNALSDPIRSRVNALDADGSFARELKRAEAVIGTTNPDMSNFSKLRHDLRVSGDKMIEAVDMKRGDTRQVEHFVQSALVLVDAVEQTGDVSRPELDDPRLADVDISDLPPVDGSADSSRELMNSSDPEIRAAVDAEILAPGVATIRGKVRAMSQRLEIWLERDLIDRVVELRDADPLSSKAIEPRSVIEERLSSSPEWRQLLHDVDAVKRTLDDPNVDDEANPVRLRDLALAKKLVSEHYDRQLSAADPKGRAMGANWIPFFDKYFPLMNDNKWLGKQKPLPLPDEE